MTLKQLLIFVISATVIFWLMWVMVLFQIDPSSSGAFGLILFYASLFFACWGSLFLLTFAWRKAFSKMVLEYKMVGTSFRQSVSFSLLIVGILFLQSKHFLTWWNILLLIVALILMEFFILSYRRNP